MDITYVQIPLKHRPPEWLYDQIMREIEPDLVTDVLTTLTQKYKKETAAQAKLREERYAKAFKIFDVVLADVLVMFEADAKEKKNEAEDLARLIEARKREDTMAQMEAQLR